MEECGDIVLSTEIPQGAQLVLHPRMTGQLHHLHPGDTPLLHLPLIGGLLEVPAHRQQQFKHPPGSKENLNSCIKLTKQNFQSSLPDLFSYMVSPTAVSLARFSILCSTSCLPCSSCSRLLQLSCLLLLSTILSPTPTPPFTPAISKFYASEVTAHQVLPS